ncbi:MAG: RagB/SusD family nutrient uptake outer membrane protein [Paludibacteraceae bacterium]|nr:RagB/SusD family nutrient uptake outer membrane protein [Paludibacteraceae bacterium]
MKRSFIIILSAAVLVLTGCQDFFNISDPKTVSQDAFPQSLSHVDQLLTSAYAQDHAIGTYAFYWLPMGVWLYDHTTDAYGSYDERAFSMDNYSSIDSRYLTTTYTDLCKWMKFATTAIEGVEQYRAAAPSSEQAQLDYMKGQALFNRALAYWHAQIFFELDADALGFPIIDKVYSDVEELKLSRATVRETWQFMIDDLTAAIPLLAGHNETYRAGEWAAKGLLAKVYMQSLYLFPENKSAAKALMEDIIQNSGKSLVSTDIYKDMFYGNEANEHNGESLYEITMTNNPTQDGPWEGYTTGSGMPMVYAPWLVDLNIRFRKGREDVTDPTLLENDVITCTKSSQWGNNFVHDKNIARFGFWNFHGDTVPRWTFKPDGTFTYGSSRSNRDDFPYTLADATYRSDAAALKADMTRVDPRLMVCAGQPYVDDYVNGEGNLTWYDRSSEVNNRPDILAWQFRKYTNIRGIEMGSAPTGLNQSSNVNFYIVRLADIYLLYAELMADDDAATALEYVNKVHRRAYGFSPDGACPYDYTSLSDRTRAYFDSDPLANDPLRYERWAELFAEGQWWFDIRRYRIGDKEAVYYQETSHGPITWKGDESYVQPIPQLELERNKNMQQSAGYAGI